MIFCSTFGNIKTRWLRLTEVYRVIYLEQVKAKVFLCSLLTKVRNRSRIFVRVGHETTYLRILWKINNLFTKSCHYQTYQSWSNPCKILSGQLSKLAVLLDPKFEKRPNFFFKTAKLIERFESSALTIRLVTLPVESRLPLCENMNKSKSFFFRNTFI